MQNWHFSVILMAIQYHRSGQFWTWVALEPSIVSQSFHLTLASCQAWVQPLWCVSVAFVGWAWPWPPCFLAQPAAELAFLLAACKDIYCECALKDYHSCCFRDLSDSRSDQGSPEKARWWGTWATSECWASCPSGHQRSRTARYHSWASD